ncbi:hypothetical protein HK104_001683 [Borealophlyctis nickersoniae]|nr:hypothetical protein HK104_001683 [Borealophlyctis nickersoniae]
MSTPYIIPSSSVVVDLASTLGHGGFGIVRKGTWCGSPVAVKVLRDQALTERELRDFRQEARTNTAIPRHTNILAFFGIIDEPGHYALVMELMPEGSLFALIDSGKSLAWDERRRIARDIACGMFCLHEGNVLHCDMKSLNVLLARDGTAKVADFGLSHVRRASLSKDYHRTSGGTLPWKAPELLTFTPRYTKECDVFSYGITLTELFTMAGPYGINYNELDIDAFVAVVKAGERPPLPSDIPGDLSDLVKECWAHDPKQRPPFSSIVERFDRSGSDSIYHSARDGLYFTPPSHPAQSSWNNDQNTAYDTPVAASGSGQSAYSTPSSSSPVASSSQPIHGGNQRSEIDNEQDPIVGEYFLKPDREADLKLERTRVEEQISRPSPTATPPISAPTSSPESAYSTPSSPPLNQATSRQPIHGANQHSDSAASDVASLTQQFDKLNLQLSELSERTERLEDQIDNETNPIVVERLEARLKNNYSRQEDIRVERTHVKEQIDRLLSPAAQFPTPNATPKSTTPSLNESPASIVNSTLEGLYDTGRALDPDYGDEESRDHSAAFAWYHEAAIAGHPASQAAVGWKYDRGLGVEKDAAQAVEWYEKAANKGNPTAQNNLGKCYQNGLGVGKDLKLAVEWYEKAAEQGLAEAQDNLGLCYQNGLGVGKDPKMAVQWFEKATEQGLAAAQNNLGNCYRNGIGVGKDKAKAVEWYRLAAKQGDACGQYNLGLCYAHEFGAFGVAKNETMAAEWYEKAAEQGYADAQNRLGYCYRNGIGVAKDKTRALEWFRKAAVQGNPQAKLALTTHEISRLSSAAAAWVR